MPLNKPDFNDFLRNDKLREEFDNEHLPTICMKLAMNLMGSEDSFKPYKMLRGAILLAYNYREWKHHSFWSMKTAEHEFDEAVRTLVFATLKLYKQKGYDILLNDDGGIRVKKGIDRRVFVCGTHNLYPDQPSREGEGE